MIELLEAQIALAATMMRLTRTSPGEQVAWQQYHRTVTALLDRERTPPRTRPPAIPTRP